MDFLSWTRQRVLRVSSLQGDSLPRPRQKPHVPQELPLFYLCVKGAAVADKNNAGFDFDVDVSRLTAAGWCSALFSAVAAVGIMFAVMYSIPPDAIPAKAGVYVMGGAAIVSFVVLMLSCKFVVGACGGSLLKPKSEAPASTKPKKPPLPAIIYQIAGAFIGAAGGFVLGLMFSVGGPAGMSEGIVYAAVGAIGGGGLGHVFYLVSN